MKTPHALTLWQRALALGAFVSLAFLSTASAQVTTVPVWARLTPASWPTNAAARLLSDPAGNLYVAATTLNPANGDTDVTLVKYGCGGLVDWVRIYDHLNAHQNDQLAGLDLDPAGNVYLGMTISAASGGGDWAVAKYDAAGTLLWRTNMGTPGYDRLVGLAVDPRGAVALAGEFDNGRLIEAWKLNALNGGPLTPVGDSPSNLGIAARAMALDPEGNVWVVGTANDRAATLRFAAAGPGLSFRGRALSPVAFGAAKAVDLAWSPVGNRMFVLVQSGASGTPDQQGLLCYLNVSATNLPLATNWHAPGQIPGTYLKPLTPLPLGTGPEQPLAVRVGADGQIVTLARLGDAARSDWLVTGWDATGGLVLARDSQVGPLGTAPVFSSVEPAALRLDGAGRILVGGTSWVSPGQGGDFLTTRYLPTASTEPLRLDGFNHFDFAGANDDVLTMGLDLAGNTLVAGASATVNNSAIATLKLSPVTPDNDACATARAIGAGTVAFTTLGATDMEPPLSGCGANARDVWFRWTAPASGQVDVDTLGSCFDTVLAVHVGTCGALTPVPGACNDNATAGRPVGTLQSFVSFLAQAGVTYFIQVGVGGTNAMPGDGRLTVFGPTPAPGQCPPATVNGGPWRKFLVIGSGNTVAGGLWRVTVPGCADFIGQAPTAENDTPPILAAKLAASLNQACPKGSVRAVAVDRALLLHVAGCARELPVFFRIGPAGTPPDQLCLVPDARADGTLDPATPTTCTYNPLLAAVVTGPDCNGNGVPDEVDIANGESQDTNANGIPDECEGGLRIRRGETSALLFWGVPDYFIESTADALDPAAWSPFSLVSPISVPLTNSARYFRLHGWSE